MEGGTLGREKLEGMTGTWAQSEGGKGGGKRMRDTAFTDTRHRKPGDGRDLGSGLRMAMDVSAGTSGGGRRVGETYRWAFVVVLVELGGRSGCNRESEAAYTRGRWGGGRM